MRKIINPGYSGSPSMFNELYQSITEYGNPTPPPGSGAMLTESGVLMITEFGNDAMITE